MVNAYILDLVGVLIDLDMNKVNEYFAQEGKSELFQLRKSPEPEVRLQAESDFEQTLERAVLSGYVPATPVPGIKELCQTISQDAEGNIVIYSNGTTQKLALTMLNAAGVALSESCQFPPGNTGIFIVDGKKYGPKDNPQSFSHLEHDLRSERSGCRAFMIGTDKLKPCLFLDDQKVNCTAAYEGIKEEGFRSFWLDRKGLNEKVDGVEVIKDFAPVISYLQTNIEYSRETVKMMDDIGL
ncbi:MAG: hypothetical protein WCV90_04895 [Candidatus Woesearchaeota archaeon]|jgi:hypothetical protein